MPPLGAMLDAPPKVERQRCAIRASTKIASTVDHVIGPPADATGWSIRRATTGPRRDTAVRPAVRHFAIVAGKDFRPREFQSCSLVPGAGKTTRAAPDSALGCLRYSSFISARVEPGDIALMNAF
jgi:hypothetical protein